MRTVTCSMGVSLDGYIVGPDGGCDGTAPDDEVFHFVTDQIRQVGVHLLGRRLYATMLYWETVASGGLAEEIERLQGEPGEATGKVRPALHVAGALIGRRA